MSSGALGEDVTGLLNALNIGLIKLGSDAKVEYINPAAERLLHRTGTCIGSSLLELAQDLPVDFISGVENSGSCVHQLPTAQEWRQVDVNLLSDGSRIVQFRDISDTYLAQAAVTNLQTQLQEEMEARRKAEVQLETGQEFLQAVLDHVQAGIVACDEKGLLKLFNNVTREFHGLTESPVPPEEWPEHYCLYDPDGVTIMRKEDVPLYRAFCGEIVRNAELVISPKNGPRRTVLSSGRALIAQDGRKLGAVVAMHDITHRKVSTRRVKDALRQFRTLFNDAPIAYHEIDPRGIILRVNRAECRLLERTREEMVGRPVWEFVAQEDREATRSALAEILEGQQRSRTIERKYLTASGKPLLFELHENLIYDGAGRITGIRTAMLDITDRNRREHHERIIIRETAAREQAEAASAEIKNILERIGDAYIAFDTEWRYTFVNQRAAELSRKPASELLGRCVWDEFPDAVHTQFYSELQRCMREQMPLKFDNYYPPLGKWFENAVYPSASGVGVFYRDITDRVATQRSLEKRTEELARKNAELETFAYVASHDLQEPLRMVSGYTTLLARRYAGALGEDADEFLGYIVNGVQRMQRLIKDLLALCRLEGGSAEHLEAVNLGAVIDSACTNLDIVMEDSGAEVLYDQMPVVRFNETRLTQLMQNLIRNAIRYRSEPAPRITVTAEHVDGAWKVAVADNGAGFDPRYADQIFEPFKRLQPAEDGGTGIGLAICKKIVESRGGRIWAESAPGAGSTFWFTIPD